MNTEQLAYAVKQRALGKTLEEIGNDVGLDKSNVCRNLARPEIKTIIEREANEFITRGLKSARKTLTRLAAEGTLRNCPSDRLKLALDASKHITSMAGLSGTSPSTVINQMIQVNNGPIQAEELNNINAFLKHTWGQDKGEVIDVGE